MDQFCHPTARRILRATSGGMRLLLAAGVVLCLAAAALAQQRDAHPAFEAASVKLNMSGSNGSSSHGTQGQIVMNNQTLKRLVERAYGVQPFQVSGPAWMESVHVDIVAKYPPDTHEDDRPLMLRALLEDRLKLTVHRESKDLPGYALMAAKSGFKLKPTEAGPGDTTSNGGRVRTLTAKKTSMEFFAGFIARNLGEPVVDKTGMQGVYDFELRWNTDDQNATGLDADVPSIFTALQETLGLRLQSQKVPSEIVVVDHVERVPTEN
jgi:uncharacterized protein (TIGR03435 family)